MTLSVWDQILFRARHRPADLAIYGPGGAVSYLQLAGQIAGLATELLERGLAEAEMVGILMPTCYLHLLLILALDRLSIPSASLPLPVEPGAFASLVERYGLAAIIAAEPPPAQLACRWVEMTEIDRPRVGAADRARLLPIVRSPDRLVRVMWSSGTAGGAKGVPFVRAQQMRRFTMAQMLRGLSRRTCHLAVMSFSSSYGYRTPLEVLTAGGTVVLPGAGADLLALAKAHGVNLLGLNPALLSELLHGPGPASPFDTLEIEIIGSHLPAALIRTTRSALGARLWSAYGATEANRVAIGDASICLSDPSAVGFLVPPIEAEIVDDEGRVLPPGEEGEIRLRGDQVVQGYFRNEAATRANFRDGWFHPGDIASIGREGLLRIVGRVEDVAEIGPAAAAAEAVIAGLPGVREAALFAWNNPAGHSESCLALVLERGASLDAILAETTARLGAAAPVRAIVLDSLPRNANGKVLKRELAALGLAGMPPRHVS